LTTPLTLFEPFSHIVIGMHQHIPFWLHNIQVVECALKSDDIPSGTAKIIVQYTPSSLAEDTKGIADSLLSQQLGEIASNRNIKLMTRIVMWQARIEADTDTRRVETTLKDTSISQAKLFYSLSPLYSEKGK
jgi:hypothetical protein